jgi:hypothetical protein
MKEELRKGRRQEYGGAETSGRPFFCRIHLFAFQKWVKGSRKISDNPKYFGFIFCRERDRFIAPKQRGGGLGRCAGRLAPHFRAKAGQTHVTVRQSLTPPGINMQIL